MEVRRLTLLLLGCFLALGGCRGGPNRISMLEQELRQQEDRIYQLQDCLQETRASLEACSQENEALRKSSSNGYSDTSYQPHDTESPKKSSELNVEIPPVGPSSGQVPKMFETDEPPSDTSSPRITPGVEAPSPRPWPETIHTPGSSGVQQGQPSRDGPVIDKVGYSKAASQIEISQLVRERPVDGEGISLVVVPLDERGSPLAAPAPVSVVVVDPALTGPAARVARWDFSPEEIASLRDPAQSDEGFRLRLKWPSQGPSHKELHLFVRYETVDGRKLHYETPFDLGRLAVAEPPRPSHSIARWQRRVRSTPPEKSAPAPRWSGTGADVSDAPAWGAPSSTNEVSSKTPPWQGPGLKTREFDMPNERQPQQVTTRPESPSWGPERR